MLKYIAVLGALTVLTACAATTGTQMDAAAGVAPAEAAQTTEVADGTRALDPDQVICKRQKVTGSRLAGQRICKTRREWDQQAAEARRSADDFINRAGGINTDGVQ